MNNKSQSSSFITSVPLTRNSKSLAISTKPAKFNTPNSSGSKSARMDSSTQPLTQGNSTTRGTRVQTDLAREAQQIPLKTQIDMKSKDDKKRFRYKNTDRDYGTNSKSNSTSFTYPTEVMFTEYKWRKPKDEVYAIKKVTRGFRDLFANISTISLTSGFPYDDNAATQSAKLQSAMWLNYCKLFNKVRTNAYNKKRNDSYTVLTKRTLWDYWVDLSAGLSLYVTVVMMIQGAVLFPGNWSMEEISLVMNSDALLLRWVDVLGQVLQDRVLPKEYIKAIMWHGTPRYAYNCPNSSIIMTLPRADLLPKESSDTWGEDNKFIAGIITDIIAIVDKLRGDDTHNRVDNLLQTCCTDRIDLSGLNGVDVKPDRAFTEMFANDTVRLSEVDGVRMYPVLAAANNEERISYYIDDSVKSPTFGAYFNTAVNSDQMGNAAKGESVTWFRRMLYLNSSESDGDKTYETNVFSGIMSTTDNTTNFKWKPRNSTIENLTSPSCHVITTSPDSNTENTKFVSVPRPGMQAVDYFTPDFQFNSFSEFVKKILSLDLID